MKQGQQFRTKNATMVILTVDGRRTIITVPSSAIITIAEDSLAGDRLIDVVWNGNTYQMFTQDLRERGERVP